MCVILVDIKYIYMSHTGWVLRSRHNIYVCVMIVDITYFYMCFTVWLLKVGITYCKKKKNVKIPKFYYQF